MSMIIKFTVIVLGPGGQSAQTITLNQAFRKNLVEEDYPRQSRWAWFSQLKGSKKQDWGFPYGEEVPPAYIGTSTGRESDLHILGPAL
jgi:hypothetical protein